MSLDQLYDVQPNVGVLVGGPSDGLRVIFRQEWPFLWLMPPVVSWSAFDAFDADPLTPLSYPTYQQTESVDDDGVRVYRYVGDR